MRFASTVIAVTAAAGVALAQNDFMIATPETLTQCQPYLIKITGGQPPFFIAVTQPGDPSSIIEQLPQTSNRQVTWPVNVPSGQKITLFVTDSTGATAPSGQSNTINAGSDDCLNKSASFSGTGNSANPSGNSGSNGGGSSTTPSSNSQNSGTTPTSDNSSSGSPSPSSESQGGNGAAQLSGYSAAVAGVVGIVVAALF